MAPSALAAATAKASTMVRALATMVIAAPPASGQTERTWRTNSCSTRLSLSAPRGCTSMCAWPFGSRYCSRISCGMSASVAGTVTDSTSRSWSSCAGRKRVSAALAASSAASGAAPRVRSAASIRTSGSAGGSDATTGASAATVASAAARIWAASGGAGLRGHAGDGGQQDLRRVGDERQLLRPGRWARSCRG